MRCREAVVQVQQASQGGDFEFLPLHVRRKSSFQNTLTFSQSAVNSIWGNATVPVGFETDYALL